MQALIWWWRRDAIGSAHSNRFDAAQARRSFEDSLKALGVDRVQILHVHDAEHATDLHDITCKGGAIDELFKIKEEGSADAVGLAMGRVDIMFPLLRSYAFDVLISHNRYSLLNRQADEMFGYASEAGVAILNAAPFAGGVLAAGSEAMPRIAYQEVGEDQLAPVRNIERLCLESHVEIGAAALAFSMRDPRIAGTIVGVSTPRHVADAIRWASTPLPEAFWKDICRLPFSTEDPEANRDYKLG